MKSKSKCSYLYLALLSFVGLGLEGLVITVEAFVFGNADFQKWDLFAVLRHWTVTSLVWLICAYLLYQSARKKGFDLFQYKSKPAIRNIIIVTGMICFCMFVSFMQWDFKFKPVAEFISKTNSYAGGGVIAFIFQYLYYFAESILVLLIVAFGQTFGETIFKFRNTKYIPWGGFVCGVTWGLMHILTQNLETGITLCFITILYGVAYILLEKNVRYAYPAIAFMFML